MVIVFAFYPYTEDLNETQVLNNALICLAQGILRQSRFFFFVISIAILFFTEIQLKKR